MANHHLPVIGIPSGFQFSSTSNITNGNWSLASVAKILLFSKINWFLVVVSYVLLFFYSHHICLEDYTLEV